MAPLGCCVVFYLSGRAEPPDSVTSAAGQSHPPGARCANADEFEDLSRPAADCVLIFLVCPGSLKPRGVRAGKHRTQVDARQQNGQRNCWFPSTCGSSAASSASGPNQRDKPHQVSHPGRTLSLPRILLASGTARCSVCGGPEQGSARLTGDRGVWKPCGDQLQQFLSRWSCGTAQQGNHTPHTPDFAGRKTG